MIRELEASERWVWVEIRCKNCGCLICRIREPDFLFRQFWEPLLERGVYCADCGEKRGKKEVKVEDGGEE